MYSYQYSQNLRPIIRIWVFLTLTIALSVTLSPYNFSQAELGSFSWNAYERDVIENLFLLFPLGFFLALFKDEMRIKDYILYGFIGLLISFFIEFSQLFLKMRSSQYWDVICNAISLIFGLLVGRLITSFFAIKTITLKPSIILLINIVFLLFALFLIRTQIHNESINNFEYLLLATIPLVIALIFSYPLILQSTAFYFTSYFISLICLSFLLLLSTDLSPISTLKTVLLLSGLAPLTLLILCYLPFIKNQNKGRLLYLFITLPFIYLAYLSSFNLDDYKLLTSDALINNNNAREVGSVATEFLLLFTITSQLIIYKLLDRKKYIATTIIILCLGILCHYFFTIDTQKNQAFMLYIYISCLLISFSNYFLIPNKKYQH